jgi:hypothetical protein
MSTTPVTETPVSERPACQQARQITGRSYLSHSQLSLMRSCPRRFAFQYIENAPVDFIPASLVCPCARDEIGHDVWAGTAGRHWPSIFVSGLLCAFAGSGWPRP